METSVPLWEWMRQEVSPPPHSAEEIPADALKSFYLAMGNHIHNDIDRLWNGPDSFSGRSGGEWFCRDVASRFQELYTAFSEGKIKSPIEGQLFAALLWLEMDWAGLPDLDLGDSLAAPCDALDDISYRITPQAQIEQYKADFFLWFQRGKVRSGVVIECDGHAFHERTKEQAAHDKKRDRTLQSKGYPVLRFTGSEIFRDPVGCAEQVHGVAFRILERVTADGRPK